MVLGRELRVFIEHAPVRRAAARVQNTWQTVDEVGRIGANFLPALIATDGPVVQSHRSIPRKPDVPLHVAIQAEEFSKVVLPEVRWIAAAGR